MCACSQLAAPQWGMAVAEIVVSSVEYQELPTVFIVKPGVGQYTACFVAYGQEFGLCDFFVISDAMKVSPRFE